MLVRVYTETCWKAAGSTEIGPTIEIDLADFSDVPTAQDIHAAMSELGMDLLGIDPNAEDISHVTIVEGTDPQWEWFEGEDPSNWTITQAWEFDQEVEQIHSSSIEEFGLFVTNYWNVRNQDATGLAESFTDSYRGTYEDGQAYAAELFSEINDDVDISVWPFTCIDWEAAWRELEISGDSTAYDLRNGHVAIFSNNY